MITFLQWRNLSEDVSSSQLDKILSYVDALFNKYKMGVTWSAHFLDQINDRRNNPGIKAQELVDMFNKEFKQHGQELARAQVGDEVLLKDLATDINMPIAIKWDRDRRMLQMKTITIIRKKNFGSDNFNNKVLAVK